MRAMRVSWRAWVAGARVMQGALGSRRLTEVLALLWLGDDVDCARPLRLFLLRTPHPEIPRRHDLLGSGSSG